MIDLDDLARDHLTVACQMVGDVDVPVLSALNRYTWLVRAHLHQVVYFCDWPIVRARADTGTVRITRAGLAPVDLEFHDLEVADHCGRRATHAWLVRDRASGRLRVLARCDQTSRVLARCDQTSDAVRHRDPVTRWLRDPDRTYDLVEYILPIEHPNGGGTDG